ncbi:carboxy terminal-processing peptidase [Pedobacter caeni]|uniref:Carboxyl-terminal processing protease n=1 Tax=Pedobacter caeni TaxID=288992 RepID=A0A1M5HGG8_9SPHI|nr:carboxy terminal-processing peptidase [Pedobacter caeni]SHG15045.1 carboxyl-terminal processing protease [Pedobacter caeni]
MLGRLSFVFFTAAVLACQAAPPKTQPVVEGIKNIKPDIQQQFVMKEVVGLIENYNYKRIKINDSVSSIILDQYIKSLDQGKNYFLSSDIKEFEKYRYELDDDFKNGDLSAPFFIYNTYAKRLNERLDYAIVQAKADVKFGQNDTYVYDRSKMPWPASTAELNDTWKRRVKYELINLNLAGSVPAKSVETVSKNYQDLKTQIGKINNQDVFQMLMDAFTASLDPHTNYFNASNAASFNEEMSRSIVGIGALLMIENEVPKIVSVVPGGPAAKGKQLSPGDRIVAVAQGDAPFVSIVGWRLDVSITKIKGAKGTKVRLKVIPDGKELSSEPVIIELIRDKVIQEAQSAQKSVKTVKSNGKDYKVGVIYVPAFYLDFDAARAGDKNFKSTTRDVKRLIDTLKNQDKVDGIVMDLRGNGGGALLEAVSLAGLFIDKGPIVQVKNLSGKTRVESLSGDELSWTGPLGVIVDRSSASSSEIFTGVIQDYDRGIVMGSQTYGKGTVQSVIDLNRLVNPEVLKKMAAIINQNDTTKEKGANPAAVNLGQINLTMDKYYRITGSSTQHKGVNPDITFPSRYQMDKIGESSQPSALSWDVINSATFQPLGNLAAVKAELVKRSEKRVAESLYFKFFKQNLAEAKKRSNERSVTLNEAKIKKERDDQEAENFTRRNELRVYRGLPVLKKGDKATKDDSFDFIEDESVKVMADFMGLSLANKKV